ncbi:hypothetical protein MUU45_001174 [Rodentibacter pneumotropicus]|uniref:DUF6378 domain-containing protein n=1 Tax=Rodentibacter pneumotropicus TaxID=758 RepID=A0AAW5LC64_9PAST|nr:DUF6378 domain-containing protein [Rodentibacter pneumotropicus]MCQ9121623.1 hypothetical protein [Rodentibacter pneumotropicus]
MNINETLQERGHTHGNFIEGSQTFDKLISAINEKRSNLDSTQYYALTMLAAKLTRILNGNAHEADHWVDSIGYLTLGGRLDIPEEPLQPLNAFVELPVVNMEKNNANE